MPNKPFARVAVSRYSWEHGGGGGGGEGWYGLMLARGVPDRGGGGAATGVLKPRGPNGGTGACGRRSCPEEAEPSASAAWCCPLPAAALSPAVQEARATASARKRTPATRREWDESVMLVNGDGVMPSGLDLWWAGGPLSLAVSLLTL